MAAQMKTGQLQELCPELQGRLRSTVAITSITQCVEELVLNAIDAAAICVAVRLDLSYGKIQVVDNGHGLDRNQLSKIANRYMSSKCHAVEDLDKLNCFGFRGEALASIRDICHILELESRAKGQTETYAKLFTDNRPSSVVQSKVHRPSCGTSVTVYDLFHALPVRKKAINPVLELERVRNRLSALALIQPSVSISLRNDWTGKKLMQTHKCNSVLGTFTALFGHGKAKSMVGVSGGKNSIQMTGYVGTEPHNNKDLQFVYINSRLVLKTRIHKLINFLLGKSSMLRKRQAGFSPYDNTNSGALPSTPPKQADKYGMFVVDITCPVSSYDITFDPSKTLVEFQNWTEVLECIEQSIVSFLTKENLWLKSDSLNIDKVQRICQEDGSSQEAAATGEGTTLLSVSYGTAISTMDTSNAIHSKLVKRPYKSVIQLQESEERDVVGCNYDRFQHATELSDKDVLEPGKLLEMAAEQDNLCRPKAVEVIDPMKIRNQHDVNVLEADASGSRIEQKESVLTSCVTSNSTFTNVHSKYDVANKRQCRGQYLEEESPTISQMLGKVSSSPESSNPGVKRKQASICLTDVFSAPSSLTTFKQSLQKAGSTELKNPLLKLRQKVAANRKSGRESASMSSLQRFRKNYSHDIMSGFYQVKQQLLKSQYENSLTEKGLPLVASHSKEKLAQEKMSPVEKLCSSKESVTVAQKETSSHGALQSMDFRSSQDETDHGMCSTYVPEMSDTDLQQPSNIDNCGDTQSQSPSSSHLSLSSHPEASRNFRFMPVMVSPIDASPKSSSSSLPMEAVCRIPSTQYGEVKASTSNGDIVKTTQEEGSLGDIVDFKLRKRLSSSSTDTMSKMLCVDRLPGLEDTSAEKSSENEGWGMGMQSSDPSPLRRHFLTTESLLQTVHDVRSQQSQYSSTTARKYPTFGTDNIHSPFESRLDQYSNKNHCVISSLQKYDNLCKDSLPHSRQSSDFKQSNDTISALAASAECDQNPVKFFKTMQSVDDEVVKSPVLHDFQVNLSPSDTCDTQSNNLVIGKQCDENPSETEHTLHSSIVKEYEHTAELPQLSPEDCGDNEFNVADAISICGVNENVCTPSESTSNPPVSHIQASQRGPLEAFLSEESINDTQECESATFPFQFEPFKMYSTIEDGESILSTQAFSIHTQRFEPGVEATQAFSPQAVDHGADGENVQADSGSSWLPPEEEVQGITSDNELGRDNQLGQDNGSRWLTVKCTQTGKNVFVDRVTGMTSSKVPDAINKISREEWGISMKGVKPRVRGKHCTATSRTDLSENSKEELHSLFEEHQESMIKDVFVKWKQQKQVGATESRQEVSVSGYDGSTRQSCVVKEVIVPKLIPHVLNPIRFTKDMLPSLKVLRQVDNKFIVCTVAASGEGSDLIVVIDQHAAHERIRLEQLKADAFETQGLEFVLKSSKATPPIDIIMQEEHIRLMTAYRKSIKKIGIEFTLDGNTVHLHTVPACLMEREASELRRKRQSVAGDTIKILIEEFLETLGKSHGASAVLPQAINRLLNSQACHGAVKFGDPLEPKECQDIVNSLTYCSLPFQCAHGRPSIQPICDMKDVAKKISHQISSKPQLWKLRQMIHKD